MNYKEFYDKVCDIGDEVYALEEQIAPYTPIGWDEVRQLSKTITILENKVLREMVRRDTDGNLD